MPSSKTARKPEENLQSDVNERNPQAIESAIERAQALVRKVRKGKQGSVVDEFIAERRADALKEDMEFNLEAHKAAKLPV